MNSYSKKNFSVTAACGFISSHLIERLIRKNFYYDIKLKEDKKRFARKNSELFKLPVSNKKIIKELKWKPRLSRIAGFKRDIQETIN
jgi:hypothetical protein